MTRSSTRWTPVLVIAALGLLLCPSDAVAGKKREKRAAQWPKLDLSPYSVLFVEEFQMTDPKARKRKKEELVASAGNRMALSVTAYLGDEAFDEVRRAPMEPLPGAVCLRAKITRYKPGSKVSRAMLIGTGQSHLDLEVQVIDAESGDELVSFPVKRTWAWGGALGASKGIRDMEDNIAQELAIYLQKAKGTAE